MSKLSSYAHQKATLKYTINIHWVHWYHSIGPSIFTQTEECYIFDTHKIRQHRRTTFYCSWLHIDKGGRKTIGTYYNSFTANKLVFLLTAIRNLLVLFDSHSNIKVIILHNKRKIQYNHYQFYPILYDLAIFSTCNKGIYFMNPFNVRSFHSGICFQYGCKDRWIFSP